MHAGDGVEVPVGGPAEPQPLVQPLRGEHLLAGRDGDAAAACGARAGDAGADDRLADPSPLRRGGTAPHHEAGRPGQLGQGCLPGGSNIAGDFKLVIRTLSFGTEKILPLPPQVIQGGLFQPISHLSWAADSVRLAVSTSAVQDNEGWGLNIVDTAAAPYYSVPESGVTTVPVTGSPTAARSYIREGVFLPDGNLFVSRACCGGVPVHNTSRLMWEVALDGALVRQVAIGYPNLEHVSLAADPRGQWLLYLAGHDLYVSQGGTRPSKLASGFIAATWM